MGALAWEEVPAAAALLARAFADQPLPRAIHGPDPRRRLREVEETFALDLGAVHGEAWCSALRETGALRGVLVAAPPGSRPLPGPSLRARLHAAWRQGLAVARRRAALARRLDAHRPPGPHWYLAALGVAPECARRGVGTALVRDWLAQVDAEGASAYLEADVPENLAFYRRFGFAPVDAFGVLGVAVRVLRRPASSGGGR
ncbi:MAG: GNAT family N-acetyltransferase [Myxococcota bacterium]|nr:GNAT family N-acetyltransferase [Myxococcota bacterium]